MRNICKSIAISLSLVALTSCGNDWLNTVPSDSVPADDAINNYKAATVALTGVYDVLLPVMKCVTHLITLLICGLFPTM